MILGKHADSSRIAIGSSIGDWKYRFFGAFVLAAILFSLIAGCWARPFNHDEGQFIASGALLAREGFLPYIDYPYFHLPNLVFVYAALFRTNDFLLLSARSFNIACAWLLILLVYAITASAFRFLREKCWLAASAAALILALNPLFRFTAGRAWNHDLAMLASAAACATFLRGQQSPRPLWWVAAAGALIGIAAGTRLTFCPLVIPFVLLSVIYHPRRRSGTLHAVVILLAAFTIALIPTILLFASSPATFFFDNYSYNGPINLLFRHSSKPSEITLGYRLLFPLRIVGTSPANLLLVLFFFVFACWIPLRQGWRNFVDWRAGLVVLVIIPFALLGAVVPSPPFRQYYYAVVPFFLLGVIFGIARACHGAVRHGKIVLAIATLLVVSSIGLAIDLRGAGVLARFDQWPVWSLHAKGLEIRKSAGRNRILTLAPVPVLEGGGRIYKELCTGSFAWRVAPFIRDKDRARYHMVGAQDLPTFLRHKPRAILTGYENSLLERPLVDYAQENAYTETDLTEQGFLWLDSAAVVE